MERRHILEGEKRVARKKVLVSELIAKHYDRIASTASELLGVLQVVARWSFRDHAFGNWKVDLANRRTEIQTSSKKK